MPGSVSVRVRPSCSIHTGISFRVGRRSLNRGRQKQLEEIIRANLILPAVCYIIVLPALGVDVFHHLPYLPIYVYMREVY